MSGVLLSPPKMDGNLSNPTYTHEKIHSYYFGTFYYLQRYVFITLNILYMFLLTLS